MTRPRANTANSLKEEKEHDDNEDDHNCNYDYTGNNNNNNNNNNTGAAEWKAYKHHERTNHITPIMPVRHLSTSSQRSSQIILTDEEKLDLLNRMHATLRYVIGNQHLVPPTTQPKSVLDVATGTGTWLMVSRSNGIITMVIVVKLTYRGII
jgi:hypothetical protein